MKKSEALLKSVLVVTAGVILAGFLMNQLRGNTLVDHARGGFNN